MITHPSYTLPRTDFAITDDVMHSFEQMFDFKTFTSLRRMVNHQQNKPLLKRTDFIKQITLYLPEVAARIEESDFGIVHLEVGALKLATRDAIRNRDLATVRRHLLLIADLFDRADEELYNAICISYIEALFLDETSATHAAARGMLSNQMVNVLRLSERRAEIQRSAAN